MEKFLIVNAAIVPDYFEKVLEARNLIEEHCVEGISEACAQVGISRSTYYKYKDHIFGLSNKMIGRKAELNLLLSHKHGVLSDVLKVISEHSCNVLAINQFIPLNNTATLSLQLDISNIKMDIDEVINQLSSIKDVRKVKLIALE